MAASLLLPRGVQEPASALYAFCRLADDAVDGTPGASTLGAVERLRERVRLAYAGTPQDCAADRALAHVVAQHGVPRLLFDALLEGFDWDLQGRRYESLDALHAYAARVAGTVGLMMSVLMGVRCAEGLARAADLGVAMQLSNIARDVGEDARMGRLYLPSAWMRDAGLDPEAWLARPRFTPELGAVIRRVLDAADELYDRVDAGVARLPLSCRPGINAARFMYAEIGHEVARRGLDAVSARARVSGARKLFTLARAAVRLAPRVAASPLPPLAATRFLVEGVSSLHAHGVLPARSLSERVLWAIELLARQAQRERHVQQAPSAIYPVHGAAKQHVTS